MQAQGVCHFSVCSTALPARRQGSRFAARGRGIGIKGGGRPVIARRATQPWRAGRLLVAPRARREEHAEHDSEDQEHCPIGPGVAPLWRLNPRDAICRCLPGYISPGVLGEHQLLLERHVRVRPIRSGARHETHLRPLDDRRRQPRTVYSESPFDLGPPRSQ